MPNQTKALSGISLIALLLALTACGDDDTEAADQNGDDTTAEENGDSTDAEEIFDFTTGFHEPVTGPYEEVLIEMPSDLLQEDDAYREDRVLDAVIVRAAEHDDAQCAVEIEYLFADGKQDEILSADWTYETSEDSDIPVEDRIGVTPDDERIVITAGIHREQSDVSDAVEYLSDDLESAVIPLDCAANEADSGSVSTIAFNAIDEWVEEEIQEYEFEGYEVYRGAHPDYSTFAEADVNVDSEGQIHIVRSHVEGWQLDANENWITD